MPFGNVPLVSVACGISIPQQANAFSILPRIATHLTDIATVSIIHLDDAESRMTMRASLQLAAPNKEHVR
jgi:hypothetical protein